MVKTHLVAWKEFNNKIGNDGTVGIYHEYFLTHISLLN
ncbi:monooxygenase family protein [Fictibacillus barbaricus]